MKEINLTERELSEVIFLLDRVLKWGVDGPYGDGMGIVDAKGQAVARRSLTKLIKSL